MPEKLMTPGVYIVEKDAFPGSVVAVETAVPAFIGYTQKAARNSKSLLNKPVKVKSFPEYLELFGGAFAPKFKLDPKAEDNSDTHLVNMNGEEKAIKYLDNNQLFLFHSIKLFFANGGGACYVLSVGTYQGKDGVEIKKEELESGITPLLKEQEPTMVVIPDAVKLGDDCYDLYKKVLAHCAKMQSRVAILDVYDGYQARIEGNADVDIITKFREKVGSENLSYAAAYYPWLNTNIVTNNEVTYMNLDKSIKLADICKEAKAQEFLKNYKPAAAESAPAEGEEGDAAPAVGAEAFDRNYHLGLKATSPTYENLLNEVREVMNLLPASGAMAGVYTSVDNNRGVWKAPANVSITGVIKPAADITHDEQENLNVDAVSGKSINAIRTFPGVGTLVWGGRTLDGNSLDWRYINVRRTMIMLEQSIKLALRAYVFEPNDANTWVTVKSMIVNFLTEKWKQGALAGASPEDAFDVQIGLGSTMTAVDILEGKMLVTVKLAIVRPAEFIVVTFEQQMQKS